MLSRSEIAMPAPLGKQLGFGQRNSLPEVVHAELFDDPAPAGAASRPMLRSYALLDGAKAPYLLTSILQSSNLEYDSLFQGETQEALAEHAPYLVELKPGCGLGAKLFTSARAMGLWEQELGIFLRSRAELPALRRHLRKFTRVQDEAGDWYYFRYWDPGIMREYLAARTASADVESTQKLASFFRDVIERVLVSDRLGTTSFSLTGSPDPAPAPFRLVRSDLDILSQARWRRYKGKLLRVLIQDHEADFRIDPAQVDAISEQAYRRNFRTEIATYDYVRAYLCCHRAGLDFEDALRRTPDGSPTERARWLWNATRGYLKEAAS